MKRLNRRQERFCQEMASDPKMTMTTAYINAGYAEFSAGNHATRLYNMPEVQMRIYELNNGVIERLGVTKEMVLEQIVHIVMFDPAEMYDEDGNMMRLVDMPMHIRDVIKEIETCPITGRVTKVKTESKLQAARELAKLMNMYEDHQKAGAGEIHMHISEKDANLC